MTPHAEARIRAAFAALADEIIAVLDVDDGPEPDRLYSIPEAAERLGGLARSTVYRLIADGELRSVKVGGRRTVPSSAIVEFARRGSA